MHQQTNRYIATKFEQPKYRKKVQYAQDHILKAINKKLKSKIKQVCKIFLYSGRAINNTTMHSLNKLCIDASTATQEMQEALITFMDYVATHPEAKIIFRRSNMQL